MTQSSTRKAALAFFEAYSDPDIEKRLYFEVWADRVGLSAEDKPVVWRDVRSLTYRFAARKREKTRQNQRTDGTRAAGTGTPRPSGAVPTAD